MGSISTPFTFRHGGGIHIEDGVWYTENKEGRFRIDPIEQGQSSKHALISYLRETVDNLQWVPACHAVWFPDVLVQDALGPAAPKQILLDRGDLDQPMEGLERVFEHWELKGTIEKPQLDSITRRLAPSHEIRITMADRIKEVDKRLARLTERQGRALNGLRATRRILVVGGAGTGKTVLAIERARLLAAEGYRVPLTCFNRPLGDHLEAVFAGNTSVDAASFHKLAHSWVRGAGLEWPDKPEHDWWNQPAAELVLDAGMRLESKYDAVIVDEGQDFSPSWFLALEGLLTDPTTGQLWCSRTNIRRSTDRIGNLLSERSAST